MRRWPGVIMLLLPILAQGQERHDSHVPVLTPGDSKPSELFNRMLSEARDDSTLDKIRSAMTARFDPDFAERAKSDPAIRDILRRLRDGDEQLLQKLQELAQRDPRLQGVSKEQLRQAARDAAGRLAPPGTRDAERQPESLRPGPIGEPFPPRGTNESGTRALAEKLSELLKNVKVKPGTTPGDSAAWQKLLKDLGQANPNFNTGGADAGFRTDLGRLERLLSGMKDWFPKTLPKLPEVTFNAPAFSSPSVDLSMGRPGLPNMPDIPQGLSTGIAIVAILGLAVYVLLQSRHKAKLETVTRQSWLLTPVDFAAVSNREQLIAAFEYLALSRFGIAAGPWHHHQVAAKLGNTGQADAATELAAMYEAARYAPTNALDWSLSRELFRRLGADGPR